MPTSDRRSAKPETTVAPETTVVPETSVAPETSVVPETTVVPESYPYEYDAALRYSRLSYDDPRYRARAASRADVTERELRAAVVKAIHHLGQREGRAPTVSEAADHLQISQEEVLKVLKSDKASTPVSLDVSDSGDEDTPARGPLARDMLGLLRIEIHGSWSVADLIKLLGHLEDAYKAAAALDLLSESTRSAAGKSADELLQTVTAFRLAGGLRLGSLSYGSPGFVEVIGALNPLNTVKDGITENREINRRRDETRRLDEREREQQVMQHKEAMARHQLEVARLQMEAEAARFGAMSNLIDRLPLAQQSVVAAQLLQQLMGAVEAIASDARVDGAWMLEQGGPAAAASD